MTLRTPTTTVAAALGCTVVLAAVAVAPQETLAGRTQPKPGSSQPSSTFYVSPAGDDSGPGTQSRPWRTIGRAARTLTAGQTVLIRAGTYAERLLPAHSGSPGRYVTFAAYPGERPVVDGARLRLPAGQAGLVHVVGRSYVKVSGLTVVNAGPDANSNGLLVDRSSHVVLRGNRTEATRSSGIGVWGSRDVLVAGNEVVGAGAGGFQESLTVAATTGFEVVGNVVRDGRKEGIDAKQGSRNGRIHGNVVSGVRGAGIYVDAWDRPTSDIDVFGNVVHGVRTGDGIAVASELGGLLRRVRIFDNVVYGNDSIGISITRNGDEGGTHPMRTISIVDNTVWRNGTTWGGGIAVDDPEARQVTVRNNIAADNRSFQLSVSLDMPDGSVLIDHNLVDGYRGDREDGETRGAAAVEGDPLFVNAAGADFHLRAGSPAIDRGASAGAPARDFDGRSRPRGSDYDIGAYEY